MPEQSTASISLTPPHEALASLVNQLTPTETERLPLSEATGRILAEPVIADRPSPACNVSAMDGYALRLADAQSGRLPVQGEVQTGHAPPVLDEHAAVRIFTGGAVPEQADTVIKREDVRESPESIEFIGLPNRPGANIRYKGENTAAGERVLKPNQFISPPVAAALANFGCTLPRVHRRPRVHVIVTGDELLAPETKPEPWQLRDSNAQTLRAWLDPLPWADLMDVNRVVDEPKRLRNAIVEAAQNADVVLLSGGVSMGDHDHVPAAVKAVGGRVIFHKLAQKPGKPMLGAIGPNGQAILGLPGNPVSVMVTARRFVSIALRKLAGFTHIDPPQPSVLIDSPGHKQLGLWWYRPVGLTNQGRAKLVPSKGSGDLVCTARSDGFIEIPPNETGSGPWPFYPWTLT